MEKETLKDVLTVVVVGSLVLGAAFVLINVNIEATERNYKEGYSDAIEQLQKDAVENNAGCYFLNDNQEREFRWGSCNEVNK